MDTVVELTAIFRMPLLWCACFLGVGSILLGLSSPQVLKAVNSASVDPVDGSRSRRFLAKSFDADHFLLKHTRLFGLCALATSVILFCQIA